jgi:hypothetical protein
MANVLPREKQIAVIAALAEGSSIRAIERMTGTNRNTIMNLGVRVGQGCAEILDAKMRDLTCHFLQFDEIWGFIGKKESTVCQPTIRRLATCGRSARLILKLSLCLRSNAISAIT